VNTLNHPDVTGTFWQRTLVVPLLILLLSACGDRNHPEAEGPTEIVVASAVYHQFLDLQRLTPEFEKAHPGIKVRYVTLEEGLLRQRMTADIATRGGQFDVMTVSSYEVPIWSQRPDWLLPIEVDAAWDIDDLLPGIREGATSPKDGKLYGAPFYGETIITMYRKDLAEKVGFEMPEQPTWQQIRDFAAAAHDPQNGVYGICLRGKSGWGENMYIIGVMVNTFGGQWFDMQWRPRIDTPAWEKAISFYVEMMQAYGQPGATSASFSEILPLFNEGKCAVWVDASSGAQWVSDPSQSTVVDHVGFANAPIALTPKGAAALFNWNLAIPASTRNPDAAQAFVRWATSREYVQLVARDKGWRLVPAGTRHSTYARQEYREAAPFSATERRTLTELITSASNATEPASPYMGIQYVTIPEFQAIGTGVGEHISAALAGQVTVEQALKAAQTLAEREMERAGYYR